jgi:transposase-like protein
MARVWPEVAMLTSLAMRQATGPTPSRNAVAELDRLTRSGVVSVRLARRAKIVLLAMRGMEDVAIAQTMGVGRAQVARWRKRYAEGGLDAIAADRPRSGRKPKVDAERILEVTHRAPPDGSRQTSRKVAAACGVSDSTVVRVWQCHGLSRDRTTVRPGATPKAVICRAAGILGLFLGPRERALALCAPNAAHGGLPALGCDAPVANVANTTPRARGDGARQPRESSASAADPTIVANRMHTREVPDATDLAWLDFLHRVRDACPIDCRVTLICDARPMARPQGRDWPAGSAGLAVELAPSALAWRGRVDRILRSAQDDGDGDLEGSGFSEVIATLVGHFAASKGGHVPFIWTRRRASAAEIPPSAGLSSGPGVWRRNDAAGLGTEGRERSALGRDASRFA